MMEKRNVVQQMNFGHRVAEEESQALASYFVQTEQWRQIRLGHADVVYGAKGSGKSALYSQLLASKDDLLREGVVLILGENPRGNTIFQDLATDPPASQEEFRALWKLFFAGLAAEELRERNVHCEEADQLIQRLIEAQILGEEHTLRKMFRSVRDYLKKFFVPSAAATTVELDPHSGAVVGLTGKICFGEPSSAERMKGIVAIDRLLELANKAFEGQGFSLWIALDRLDVAFAENLDLEQNALRALFTVYLDLKATPAIVPKIFLRSDIWRRITSVGFREASHVTKTVTIRWSEQSLLNLVVRRALNNEVVRSFYSVSGPDVLGDFEKQWSLFYRMFPDKVEGGQNKPKTFDWMLSHTRDSSNEIAPRELIHLLTETRDAQIKRYENGFGEPAGEMLFDRPCLKEAMLPVSKARLELTLFAEHPELRSYLLKLEGEKTEQTLASLGKIWATSDAVSIANTLVEVGFFQKPDSREEPRYWVPFLYRPGLGMIQGRADA